VLIKSVRMGRDSPERTVPASDSSELLAGTESVLVATNGYGFLRELYS